AGFAECGGKPLNGWERHVNITEADQAHARPCSCRALLLQRRLAEARSRLTDLGSAQERSRQVFIPLPPLVPRHAVYSQEILADRRADTPDGVPRTQPAPHGLPGRRTRCPGWPTQTSRPSDSIRPSSFPKCRPLICEPRPRRASSARPWGRANMERRGAEPQQRRQSGRDEEALHTTYRCWLADLVVSDAATKPQRRRDEAGCRCSFGS